MQTRPARSRRICSPRKSRASSIRIARTTRTCKYVVIVGGDSAIPFFRYPDQSLLGQESGYVPPVDSNSASEASLRRDFVLGQDAYGAGTQVSLRTSNFPVPGLAVGRLVESPTRNRRAHRRLHRNGRRRRPELVAGDGLRLPGRCGERRADGTAEGHRRAFRHADRAEQPVARGPAVLDGLRPRRQAARQPPRHHLPGRALQRQQRARRRLQDQPADDRPRRLVGEPDQLDRVQRRLPLRLQHRRRRRDSGRDADPRLGAGVRAEEGDADRGHRLPVRRHRLHRVQRAAVPELRAAAARGTRPGPDRRGAGQGQARIPRGDARHPRHPRKGAARSDAVRPADARREHAERPRRKQRHRRRGDAAAGGLGPGGDARAAGPRTSSVGNTGVATKHA